MTGDREFRIEPVARLKVSNTKIVRLIPVEDEE